MIVTLTPNPSLDRTVTVERLTLGEVHRVTSGRIDPGGKGINVSRALAAQGGDTLAVLPVGGAEGGLLTRLLDEAGVAHRDVAIGGTARMNVAVVEPGGRTTKVNEAGPQMTPAEVDALLAATLDAARGARWVVGCGSLPPGAPTSLYADLVASARSLGVRVAIDSSGAPLPAAVAAGPSLIKPNHEELAELVGHALPRLGDVVAAARELVAGGVELVVVSLGADGAVAVDADSVCWTAATIERPLSTVGAGDCLLAGVLHTLDTGGSLADALTTGVRWGAAAVTLPGSRIPTPRDLAGIEVAAPQAPDAGLLLR
ncbi:1-phosphofructokinase [Calidifontibacter sp. DB0510]|uniref:1-phosphofructokinase n=1 Tax=Metallococcus carri TaxID=1656884 RepID=A0A967B1Y7_9MICO|nr:1-phosphofructokinase [Metallococcus carri]NHN57336.1 1-phosphofructokinase [Metallococcus carri]NOP38059.1 1-phosphofructokinase [Calidifontibacter sp. DB2511S]